LWSRWCAKWGRAIQQPQSALTCSPLAMFSRLALAPELLLCTELSRELTSNARVVMVLSVVLTRRALEVVITPSFETNMSDLMRCTLNFNMLATRDDDDNELTMFTPDYVDQQGATYKLYYMRSNKWPARWTRQCYSWTWSFLGHFSVVRVVLADVLPRLEFVLLRNVQFGPPPPPSLV
jgi:hypothetical protein